jgi:hypothetical protein
MMLDMLLSDTPLQGGIMGMAADGAGLFNKIKKIFS